MTPEPTALPVRKVTRARRVAASSPAAACVYFGTAGAVVESVDGFRAISLTCETRRLDVAYDGSTAVTLTGGSQGAGCTPATLHCHDTTSWLTGENVAINYTCVNGATTCPVTSSSTLYFLYHENGSLTSSTACRVTESPIGTFHCQPAAISTAPDLVGVVSTVVVDDPTVGPAPQLHVTYDGTTGGPALAVTLTGGSHGPGCTPATLHCDDTTSWIGADPIFVDYTCVNGATTCPVVNGSTLSYFFSVTGGSGGTGESTSCVVTESPTGTFRCRATVFTSPDSLPNISFGNPTIS